MPNTKIVETVPFNYEELYTGLETKFADAGYDNAPGSNVSQLITSMAYFTSMLNINTAVNINETLLPLATQRDNVLEDARAFGYEIQHKQSYTYKLTLTLSGDPQGNYIIPKYSMFSEGTKKYYYMGEQIELTAQPDGTLIELIVKEGTLFLFTDYPALSTETVTVKNEANQDIPQYYVDVPFVDIEANGIECFITYYDNFGTLIQNEKWTQSEHFAIDKDLVLKNNFFRLDDIKFRTPRLYFQLAGIGTGIRIGTTVNINVLQTSGINGKMQDINTPSGIKHTLSNVTVSAVTLITEGADEETLQSIKDNAPKFYNSANRAVTPSDYQAICNRQSTVKDSFIWGGEEELPKSPGHIWFSFLPSKIQRVHNSDSFNKSYLLDNYTYTNWDYTLTPSADPVNAPGPYEAQLSDALAFYSSQFVEDGEIRTIETTNTGQLINPGIWDVLDKYKIPTLEFHNRHPIYLDFEYDIEVLKYNVVTSKADVNSTIFNVIDGFFTGVNDTLKMEQFGVSYFHSSLEKRIDTILTDASGYNNTVSTKFLLTLKNVQKENLSDVYRDIFIPMDTPLETYFDTNGYLLYNVLPNIDTNSFIDTRTASDIANGVNIPSTNLYTDWSDIQTKIDASTTQIQLPIITAPIRCSLTETSTPAVSVTSTVTLVDFGIFPDDPSTVDLGTPVYNKTIVTHIAVGGAETVLSRTTDWTHDPSVDAKAITLVQALQIGESIRVDTEAMCGSYILFNSFKKYITVQLYVDGTGYIDPTLGGVAYSDPKSYLTTTDILYDYTIDSFYLTTEGYSLTSQAQIDATTGPIIKTISPHTYTGSPLKMDLFRRDRYINLKYNSPNFTTNRNVISRLKRVTFK